MKLIFINGPHGRTKTLEFRRWSVTVLSLCCVSIPLGLTGAGYYLGSRIDESPVSVGSLREDIEEQSRQLSNLQDHARSEMRAMTISIGKLQARLTRMDALGVHLTNLAGVDNEEEFNFAEEPSVGGPLLKDSETSQYSQIDLLDRIQQLENKISDRLLHLEALEGLIRDSETQKAAKVSGWPVKKGWISSAYGRRTDPFTGQLAMHHGVDFAGNEGNKVLALGAGLITHSGYRQGYGQMVEISHGDGYRTRYAHAQKNLVEIGQLVEKGEPIALVGSTGRSTGAHVHLEVYKNGRPIDPSSYIKRTQP